MFLINNTGLCNPVRTGLLIALLFSVGNVKASTIDEILMRRAPKEYQGGELQKAKDLSLIKAIGDLNLSEVETLLQEGATTGAGYDWLGVTPLMYAIRRLGNREDLPQYVRLLLTYGSDVNAADEIEGMTPLMYAAQMGSLEALRLLLEAEGVDFTAIDNRGHNTLDYARKSDHPEIKNKKIQMIKRYIDLINP